VHHAMADRHRQPSADLLPQECDDSSCAVALLLAYSRRTNEPIRA
jgi:hypothetical protein